VSNAPADLQSAGNWQSLTSGLQIRWSELFSGASLLMERTKMERAYYMKNEE
jgi:hypothetical protein